MSADRSRPVTWIPEFACSMATRPDADLENVAARTAREVEVEGDVAS
jgi:hypothetical protein